MADTRELLDACVHCGFCLPSCPTYSLWGDEMDSPRGRIHLMNLVEEGEIELDLALLDELHQVDAPAGRVHLVAPQRVGRARWQAESAVDAGVEQLARLSHRMPPRPAVPAAE